MPHTSSDDGASITDYTWDFGDGQTAGGPTATTSHTYTSLGTYNVTLIVTNSDGASDSITQQITVDNPTASFTAPQTVAPGAQASFDASASSDPLGTITDYSWDFGDGSQPDDTGTNPVTDTHSVRQPRHLHRDPHDHQQPGTAGVREPRCHGRHSAHRFVHPADRDPGHARRRSASTGPVRRLWPRARSSDYTWDFGDGTAPVDTQTSAIASHSYNAAGMYTVRLTVKDDLGLTGTTTQTVTVDHPAAAFAVPAHAGSGRICEFRRERLDRSSRARSSTTAGTSATGPSPTTPARRPQIPTRSPPRHLPRDADGHQRQQSDRPDHA